MISNKYILINYYILEYNNIKEVYSSLVILRDLNYRVFLIEVSTIYKYINSKKYKFNFEKYYL